MVSILDDLRDRDMVAVENGTWQIKVPLESIHLEAPESLRQMIELQIEKLTVDEQRVLELASMTGMSFTANANVLGATVDQEKLESTLRRPGATATHRAADGTSEVSRRDDFAML